jgi:hypothetical protein
MKICVLNFSGNVGKSTIAAHLLQPRMNAQVFSVESLNVDASSDGVEVARLRGKHYNDLLQRLMKLDDAIVDVGSSNVEDFLKMMQHYADSQEEFDLFVVPVVKDGKQQADTVNTIRALRAIGVPVCLAFAPAVRQRFLRAASSLPMNCSPCSRHSSCRSAR